MEVSAECLEIDKNDCSLFCYLSNSSIINLSIIDQNLLVDCVNFSVAELQEFQFQCYAIVPPAGLGIAVAAALGLAKVVIVGVTIYDKVTEWFVMVITLSKTPFMILHVSCA